MSFSTNDLRSGSQDTKRAANRKHKWALGTQERVGRGAGNPRPVRASETVYNAKRHEAKSAAVTSLANGAKMARKHDVLEGAEVSTTEESAGSSSDFDEATVTPAADAGIMYSFDADRGPSQGSQIFIAAMSKAEERFQERETARIVGEEYEVLDSEGEIAPVTPIKKIKGKKTKVEKASVPDADEDWECI